MLVNVPGSRLAELGEIVLLDNGVSFLGGLWSVLSNGYSQHIFSLVLSEAWRVILNPEQCFPQGNSIMSVPWGGLCILGAESVKSVPCSSTAVLFSIFHKGPGLFCWTFTCLCSWL